MVLIIDKIETIQVIFNNILIVIVSFLPICFVEVVTTTTTTMLQSFSFFVLVKSILFH